MCRRRVRRPARTYGDFLMNCHFGRSAPLFATALLCLTGCLTNQVARDGRDLRQAVLAMYTDQAMDCLINAYENKPFVQVEYGKISVNDADTLKGSGSIADSSADVRPLG